MVVTVNDIIRRGWDSINIPKAAFAIRCNFGPFDPDKLCESVWFDYVGFEYDCAFKVWCLTWSVYPLKKLPSTKNFKKIHIVKREVKRLLKKTLT